MHTAAFKCHEHRFAGPTNKHTCTAILSVTSTRTRAWLPGSRWTPQTRPDTAQLPRLGPTRFGGAPCLLPGGNSTTASATAPSAATIASVVPLITYINCRWPGTSRPSCPGSWINGASVSSVPGRAGCSRHVPSLLRTGASLAMNSLIEGREDDGEWDEEEFEEARGLRTAAWQVRPRAPWTLAAAAARRGSSDIVLGAAVGRCVFLGVVACVVTVSIVQGLLKRGVYTCQKHTPSASCVAIA